MIEKLKFKLHNWTIKQKCEMDDTQWISRGLPNMEDMFLCLCTNQGPLRNFHTHTLLTYLTGQYDWGQNANDAQTRECEVQTQARATAANENANRKNQIWCHLAMTLDARRLMLIRHACVNSKGLGYCQKAWLLLWQRFGSDETTTVISLMKQWGRQQIRQHKAIHQYFFRAQELVTRLQHAGDEHSETLFNAMVLSGLPQR